MTWTNFSFSVGQVLTAAQMNNLYSNFAAIAAGDAGAPSIQQAALAANAVGEGQIDWASGMGFGFHYLDFSWVDNTQHATGITTYTTIPVNTTGTYFKGPATAYRMYIPAGTTNMNIALYGESYDINVTTSVRFYNASCAPVITMNARSSGLNWSGGSATCSALAGTLASFTIQYKINSGSYATDPGFTVGYVYFD